MAEKTNTKKKKRASKSQRIYLRRLKQAARNEIGMNTPHSGPAQTKQDHKKKDKS